MSSSRPPKKEPTTTKRLLETQLESEEMWVKHHREELEKREAAAQDLRQALYKLGY